MCSKCVSTAECAEERRTMLMRQNPVAARPFTGIKRLCCLVVDDSQTNRFLAGHLVKKVLGDVDVVFAESGEAALEKVEMCSPDLILMDVRMPVGRSGIEATRRIRETLKFVPIVAVTGAGDEATVRIACKEAGMNDVLVKPLRQEQLVAAIFPLLRQSSVVPREESLLFDDSFLDDVDVASRKLLLEDWRTTCGEQITQLFALCAKQAWNDLQDVAHS
jgi:CheY-like chemotaxis protein